MEKYNENETSFYDNTFIVSPYIVVDKTKHHFISLPGIIAFLFYAGSYWFLFLGMFIVGLLGAMIEVIVYKLGDKNIILCSLLSQIVAFRFAGFGYVPSQSYLLFGAVLLNVFLFYLLNNVFIFYDRKLK